MATAGLANAGMADGAATACSGDAGAAAACATGDIAGATPTTTPGDCPGQGGDTNSVVPGGRLEDGSMAGLKLSRSVSSRPFF